MAVKKTKAKSRPLSPKQRELLARAMLGEDEATCLLQTKDGRWHDLGFMRYKNPFGDITDGRADAAITATFGIAVEAAVRSAWRAQKEG